MARVMTFYNNLDTGTKDIGYDAAVDNGQRLRALRDDKVHRLCLIVAHDCSCLDDACHASPILPATALKRTSANRLR